MSSHRDKPGHDDALRDALKKIGQAYGQLEREEPPALLDQAVLNSAQRAVEGEANRARFGWLHGLTTAAVFVLALAIVLDQRQTETLDGIGVDEIESARLPDQGLGRQPAGERPGKAPAGPDARAETSDSRERAAARGAPLPAALKVAEPEPSGTAESVLQSALRPAPDAGPNGPPAGPAHELRVSTVPVDREETGETRSQLSGEAAGADANGLAGMDPVAERELARIGGLKDSGDPAWRRELEIFRANYPGYPIPEELRN